MAFQDIRKSRKFLSPTDVGFILGVLILIAALLALNIYMARTLKGGEWLFLRWSGARAFLFEKIEPYGPAIAQRVQSSVYGRDAFLAEYPYILDDPFYIVLLYTPIALFSDFTMVQSIWMLFSQIALIGIVLLSLRLAEWEPPRWMLIVLIGFGLFSYFSVNAFLSASPTIFLTLTYLIILVALRSFADELAGALLFLVAYQWEVGALFFLFILVFVIANRRWSMLTGFGMTLVVMLIVSLIINSGWIVPFLRATIFNWRHATDYTFQSTLAYMFPKLNIISGRWFAIIFAVVILFEAIRSINEHFRHITWVACLALAINPLMGFAIFPSNHIVLLPALILVVALAWERWTNWRVLASLLLLSFALMIPFGLYYQTIHTPERIYSDLLKILPPILTLIGLYWMRWWVIRPPRLWADQVAGRK